MDRKFVTFLVLSLGIILLWMTWQANLAKKQMEAQKAAAKDQDEKDGPDAPNPPDEKDKTKPWWELVFATGDETPEIKPDDQPPEVEPPKERYPHKLVTLGSMRENNPYRFLATLDTRAAALRRIELVERTKSNKLRYSNLDDESGYLGHLGLQDVTSEDGAGDGCKVRVVGDGTPANVANLRVEDVITHVKGQRVKGVAAYREQMKKTEPGDQISITVQRAGQPKPVKLKATLTHRPRDLVRPEPESELDALNQHPLSMLLTLRRYKNRKLEDPFKPFLEHNWDVTVKEVDKIPVSAEFRYDMEGLRIIKRYRLAKTPKDEISNPDFNSYHLVFEIEFQNLRDDHAQTVAYQLDGPTGLPIEGWWSPMKVHPNKVMGGAGPRDVIAKMANKSLLLVTAPDIADNWMEDEVSENNLFVTSEDRENRVLQYVGVDTQYFSVMLVPAGEKDERINDFVFRRGLARPVTSVSEDDNIRRTNVTFQLISEPMTIDPGKSETRRFTLYAGPNQPDMLEQYGIEEVKEYGWYGWISKPLTGLLHIFFSIIPNFAIAIIMLTVVVRLCMMPLSRKAAKNAEMMKLLQPEMKKIQEKYKKDMQKRAQAQRELFARYKYNPLGGCLLMLLQLPVFIGLYRGLSIDNALRGEALIPGLGWCSNLAAPDQFLYWGNAIPFLTGENGFLGPYLNILPLVTVALFIVQQKMLTPKAQDEQQQKTQRIMMFMTVFIGLLFFKVPSGLCIYFITSSVWGVAERKLLPKPKLPEKLVPLDQRDATKPTKKSGSKPSGNGASDRKAKNKAREKLRQKRK